MSAYYGIVRSDRVELLTDGAVYLDDGTLVAIKRKVHQIGDLPLVLTTRGSGGVAEALCLSLSVMAALGSVDGVLSYLEELLEDSGIRTQLSRLTSETLITGISESRGPFAVFFYGGEYGGADIKPFTLYDTPAEYGGGPAIRLADLPFKPEAFEAAGNDAMRLYGADIMEAMRMKQAGNPAKPDLPEMHGIGGHCDLTTVTQGNVTTERLRTWPDAIGKKIDPHLATQDVRKAA